MRLIRDEETGELRYPDEADTGTPTQDDLGGLVPMITSDGKAKLVAPGDVALAESNGWRQSSLPELGDAKHEEYLEEKYGDSPVEAFAGSAASGLTLGISDLFLDEERAREVRSRSPIASVAGEVTGLVGLSLVPGVGQAGLIGKAGQAAGRAVAGAVGKGVAGRALSVAAREGVQGAIYGAGTGISESALSSDPDLTGEEVAANIAKGALWGAAGGAVVGSGLSLMGDAAGAARIAAGRKPVGIAAEGIRTRGTKWAASKLPEGSEARTLLEKEGLIERLATSKGDDVIRLSAEPENLAMSYANITKTAFEDARAEVVRLSTVAARVRAESTEAWTAHKAAKAALKAGPPKGIADASVWKKEALEAVEATKVDADALGEVSRAAQKELKLFGDQVNHFQSKYSEKVLGQSVSPDEFTPIKDTIKKAFTSDDPTKLKQLIKDTNDLHELIWKRDADDRILARAAEFGRIHDATDVLLLDRLAGKLVNRSTTKGGVLGGVGLAGAAGMVGMNSIPGAMLGLKAVEMGSEVLSRLKDPFVWLRKARGITGASGGTADKVINLSAKLFATGRKGASKVATPSVLALTAPRKNESKDEAYDRRTRRALSFAADAVAKEEVSKQLLDQYGDVAPKIIGATIKTLFDGAQFLASKVPRDPLEGTPAGLLRPVPWRPSDADIAKWNRYYAAVKDPTSILTDAKNGLVSKDAVEAVKTVYPKLYVSMQDAVMKNLAALKTSLPYKSRLAMSTLFDVPVDASMEGSFLIGSQGRYAQKQEAQPLQTSAPGTPKGSFSTLAEPPKIGSTR